MQEQVGEIKDAEFEMSKETGSAVAARTVEVSNEARLLAIPFRISVHESDVKP